MQEEISGIRKTKVCVAVVAREFEVKVHWATHWKGGQDRGKFINYEFYD